MKLFFRKLGSGPPLVILHGLYGSSDNWITIAKAVSSSFTVYLPDQRNHGQSPHSMIHDYESMKNDLLEFITELGIGKFFLAGHSMGGKTAVGFALSWPEKLNGLMIADISPVSSGKSKSADLNQHLEIITTILSVDLSEIKSRKQAEAILAERLPSGNVTQFILKNLSREPDNSFQWKLNAAALLQNITGIMDDIPAFSEETAEITGFPVYFLKGEHSDYLKETDYGKILKIFPGAEFIVIPGAGHWIHSDNPEAVIKSLLRFVGSY
jgi:pimeloyl-ACP methyl ester carboxylesterase